MERRLWWYLRDRLPGVKFRRQLPLGPYICDFVSFQARLVVEVDGSQHGSKAEYDKRRDDLLGRFGFATVRFSTYEVHAEIDGVLDKIARLVRERTPG